VFGDDSVQVVCHNAAARRGEDIANKEDIHCGKTEQGNDKNVAGEGFLTQSPSLTPRRAKGGIRRAPSGFSMAL